MKETRFKDTEIGYIPNEWEVKSLGEICEIITKGTTPPYFTNNGIKFIKIENFVNGVIDSLSCSYVDLQTHNTFLKRSILQESDILFAIAGATVGKNAIVKKELLPANTNQALAIIRLKNKKNAIYIHWVLNSMIKELFIRNSVKTGAQPNLTLEQMNNFLLPLPPLPEQCRIASALSDIDTLIQKLEILIQKKQNIKQGAMQQLLTGKKRLKGFSEPWVKSLIKDLYHVTRGYVLAMTKVDNHKSAKYPYPVFSSQTKDNGIAGYYSQYLYENAITWTTDGANAGDVKYRNGKFYCTNVCGVLLSDNGMANLCMAGILGLVSKSHVSYIGNPKLMNNTMAEIEIYHPSDVKEQIAISDILIKIDDEITSLEAKKAKYEQIKQGMMQQLLTGKIRLTE